MRTSSGVEIAATGKSFDFAFSAIFRIVNGRIASIRLYYDQLELLTQLGLMPAPAQA